MWLHYIITQRERNLSVICADLCNLQEELSTFSDVATFDSWDQKVNEQTMEYDFNLISKKSGKFERGKLDYLNNREFKWKKSDNVNKNNQGKMNSEQSIESNEYNTQSQGHHLLLPQTDVQRNNNTKIKIKRNKTSHKFKHRRDKRSSKNKREEGGYTQARPHRQQYPHSKSQHEHIYNTQK